MEQETTAWKSWKLELFQESNRSNFQERFLIKIEPPKEKITRKRVKVGYVSLVMRM